jgi:hypothetical protein
MLNMLSKLLLWYTKSQPYTHLPGYMNRWWLVPYATRKYEGCGLVSWSSPLRRVLQNFGIAVRVHEILSSDYDRSPHNHPWDYWTLILSGGYEEHEYTDDGHYVASHWRGPGTFLRKRAESMHRLEIRPYGDPVVTLFVTFKQTNKWGFYAQK